MLKMTMYDCNCVSHGIVVFYGCINLLIQYYVTYMCVDGWYYNIIIL